MITPLAIVLGLLGAAWGFGADRIAARWPEHEDGHLRPIDWRTPVAVVTGGLALGALTLAFGGSTAVVLFGVYLGALVLLLATDLDQRLLPDVVTLPAIPIALCLDLVGSNPLVAPGDLPIAIAAAVGIPLVLALIAIPFGAGAIGMGDLKLLVSLGLLAGPYRMFGGVMYGALLAGVVIIVLLVARRITLRTYIPFGPFLIFGAMWGILVIR
jgi:leader peptidase (prepilin peptidase) / N-methyltransferase